MLSFLFLLCQAGEQTSASSYWLFRYIRTARFFMFCHTHSVWQSGEASFIFSPFAPPVNGLRNLWIHWAKEKVTAEAKRSKQGRVAFMARRNALSLSMHSIAQMDAATALTALFLNHLGGSKLTVNQLDKSADNYLHANWFQLLKLSKFVLHLEKLILMGTDRFQACWLSPTLFFTQFSLFQTHLDTKKEVLTAWQDEITRRTVFFWTRPACN